jgi:hypothetical protein
MDQCHNLKALTLERIALDEDHIRVLGALSRSGLEIKLIRCRIAGAAAAVLAQFLGRNQGPTKLDCCYIDNSVLANGLRGNSHLKLFRALIPRSRDVANREVLAIAGGLRENKGLVDLDFRNGFRANEESRDAVCDSLKTHPTLEVLRLDPPVLSSRIQAFVDMLKVSTSIHTIYLHFRYREHELYRGSVIPYLERNKLRPRLLAIQRALPITYRAKVLGRALFAVRTDPNRFWMLLSGNAEVAFPSSTTTIAAAANLPTHANAADTSAAMIARIVATASTTAASSVVTPAAGQKCKASP